MPTLVTPSTLNFIHFLLVYFGLLVCPTQCLESKQSLKSLGKPYIFRKLKAKKQNTNQCMNTVTDTIKPQDKM